MLRIKEQIVFGRIKGGERLPTMNEISKATGLSFYLARGVVERLVNEGYVHSRPHEGTFVLLRGKNILRGRVLMTCPDIDICRYYPTQFFDTINRRLTASGYAVTASSFPFGAGGSLSQLRSELLRASDLVIACRAIPTCGSRQAPRHESGFARHDYVLRQGGKSKIFCRKRKR